VTTDERPEAGGAPGPVSTASSSTTSHAGPPASQSPASLAAAAESPHILAALEQLKGVLVPGETLEAYAVQRRIFALTKRRALVAATSGRFIALLRGFFGGFTPVDMRWQDIEEAHLKVGIVGADITVRAMRREDLASANLAGGIFFAAGLRKEQAQGVYRVCQAQSQSWREKRRIRDLDELRAKSGGIQFGGGVSGPGGSGRDDGDPVARLQRAKEMLTEGLITDAEYESIKAKIVDRL
jgi:hypothetical protein